jgi:hypothetical protein
MSHKQQSKIKASKKLYQGILSENSDLDKLFKIVKV